METIEEKLALISRHVEGAVSAVEQDKGASPVLRAVVMELRRKAEKAVGLVKSDNPRSKRDAVIEVEQAADSAKMAADADLGAAEATRTAVSNAHMSFCLLKAELGSG